MLQSGFAKASAFPLDVQVGQVTVHQGTDIHTGLTVILPRGAKDTSFLPCYGAIHSLNGMGELTGSHALTEYGYINIVSPAIPLQPSLDSALFNGSSENNIC